MHFTKDHVLPVRVLNEDNDFMLLEVGKHDEVKFTLHRDANGEVIGGDRFHTILFIKFENGEPTIWKPWEESAD